MKTKLEKFEFAGQSLRVVTDEAGVPWIAAKDVCEILDLDNQKQALDALPEKHLGYAKIHTSGGEQNMRTVSEAGLYRLVFRSKKAEAQEFQDWVTETVLPSIRKTGGYDHAAYLEEKRLRREAEGVLDKIGAQNGTSRFFVGTWVRSQELLAEAAGVAVGHRQKIEVLSHALDVARRTIAALKLAAPAKKAAPHIEKWEEVAAWQRHVFAAMESGEFYDTMPPE